MSDAPVFTDPMSGLPIPPLPVPRLPTPDEFLGPERLPTPDEFLGPEPTNVNALALGGADMDEYFSSGSMDEILGHFAQGARHAWGTTPLGLSPKAEKGLKDLGLFNDHEKNQFNIIREFNEGLIRPSAVAIDTMLRGVNAGVRGVSEVMVAAGVPKDLTPQAPWEAFPAGRGTGLPARIHPNLARAAELGVIGKGEAGWRGLELETAEAVRRMEPTGVERATERVITAPEPLSSARGTGLYVADVQPDIHHFARQVAPETFAEYDALAAQRETFGQRLAELGEARRNTPEAVRLQAQMDTIMTRAHGREANMTTAAQRRYNTAHFALEDLTTLDTPEMARVRQSLQEVDFRRRDLAPEVSAAYRKAQEGMPAAEAPVAEALPRPAVEAPVAQVPPAVAEVPAAEMRAPVAPEAVAAAPVETPAVVPRTEAPPVVPEAAAPAPAAAAVEPAAPPIAPPAAPRVAPARVLPPGGIVEDVSRQLVAAGRPVEEAQAAAALVDAHYSARAEWFAGARGTGEELYLADAPQVRAGRNVRALEMAQRQLDQPAYHGSPYVFDKFSLDHMGEGEGAQAYGHGLYFAGNKEVARYYRDALGPQRAANEMQAAILVLRGQSERQLRRLEVKQLQPDFAAEIRARPAISQFADDPKIMADVRVAVEAPAGSASEVAAYSRLDTAITQAKKGRLYHVELAPKAHEYLDWDKPLSEQSEKVRKFFDDPNGVLFNPGTTGAEAYRLIGWGNEAGASDALREAGIRGIRYLDQGSRAGGKGTHNFVIFDAADIEIRTFEQPKRGSIRLAGDDARATVTLFKDADASTFIHETGHQWLEELVADAAHERAPPDLIADASTVRTWLGVEDGATIPTRAHEKFARGFERYMMEGHAPSQALADVFAKFRDWLTRIYETVARLRAPINDDIRGVFDRMLAHKGEGGAVIAPERAREFTTDAPKPPRGDSAYDKLPPEPRRLVDFLRREGGIQDVGGDIRSLLGRAKDRPGLINGKGMSLERAVERAQEEGYFHDKPSQGQGEAGVRADINDLLDAISEDLSGNAQYSYHDRSMVDAYRRAIEQNAEVDRLGDTMGISPRDHTREQFHDIAAEHLSREELAREIGARDADAELAIADAERQAKEWAESRGDAWEPDADNATVVPRTLEDMENAYKQEAAAARDARESPGGPVPPGPAAGDQGGLQEGVRQRGPGAGSPGRAGPSAGEAPTEPSARFGRADERLIDKAGNIRIDNLNIPEDVAQAIRDAAAEAGGFIEARRGVLSDAEVLSLADAMGMGPKEIARRKVGEAFNAEEVVAARKLLIRSATDVRDAMIRAAEGTDVDVVAYAEAKARHMMIQEQVSGITAEAGRALRAFRAIEGSKEAGALGEFLKENTGRTLNQMRREAQLGLKLETPQQVAKFVRDSEKPGWKDYIIEAWINALLSGPMTHVKNVIGNSAIAVNSIIETGGAAAVGAARQMLPGAAAERVFFRETEARVFGLVQGSKDGIIAAGKSLLDENFTPREARTIEQRRYQAIPSIKVNVAGIDMELGGKQVRIPGRLLTAEDEFFKAIATRQEMNALAYRQAISEGLSGDAFHARVADLVQNPTDALIDQARQHAQYQTFTNPLGTTGRSFQQFANSHILAKVILPFVRTPINILKYAHERTPLGLASREVRANLSGENGVVARDTQVARMALGSMVATAVAGFAVEGLITGGGPSDPKAKATLRLTGWQPYSLKIGNMYYSYAWLDPLGTIMGVTADVTHITQLGLGEGAAEYDKLGAMMVFSLSKNLLSKASLRGASDLITALTEPDRYGPRYVQNLAGSVVPSVLGQIARSADPLLREARTVLDSIKSRIPGLSMGLMPKRNIWGEPIARQGALGPDVASPIYQSAVSADPVNLALERLHITPDAPERKIRGVELTDQQFDDYSRIGGRLAKIRLDSVVGMPGFATLPALTQGEMITKTVDSSRELARAQVMMQSVGTQNDIMRQAVEMKVDMLSK